MSGEGEPRVWPGRIGRILASVGLLAGMVGIFFLSEASELPQPPLIFPGLDKLEHAAAFGILGVLAYLALGVRHRGGKPDFRPILLAVVIVTLYAVFDELHQARVPGRNPSFYDGLADMGGAILAVTFCWKLFRRALRRRGVIQKSKRPPGPGTA
ncbi:MAG TPA: VanZ family protein [bacterium]|nr:VanZ family protein [bacterium]